MRLHLWPAAAVRARIGFPQEVSSTSLLQSCQRVGSGVRPQWIRHHNRVLEDLRNQPIEEMNELRVGRSAGKRPDELAVDGKVNAGHTVVGKQHLRQAQLGRNRSPQARKEKRPGPLTRLGCISSLAVDPNANLRKIPLRKTPPQLRHEPFCRALMFGSGLWLTTTGRIPWRVTASTVAHRLSAPPENRMTESGFLSNCLSPRLSTSCSASGTAWLNENSHTSSDRNSSVALSCEQTPSGSRSRDRALELPFRSAAASASHIHQPAHHGLPTGRPHKRRQRCEPNQSLEHGWWPGARERGFPDAG